MYIWIQGNLHIIILLGTIIKYTHKKNVNYAQEVIGYKDYIITQANLYLCASALSAHRQVLFANLLV